MPAPAPGRRRGLGQPELRLAVLDALHRAGNHGLAKRDIVAAIGQTSAVSVQRALDHLRERDAQIEHSPVDRRWRLAQPFAMPLDAPEADDVVAVLVAKAILAPLADADLVDRIQRLAEQLDERRRSRETTDAPAPAPAHAPVTATLTLGTPVDPGVLQALLAACRRHVLRIEYTSPWKPVATADQRYEIEPWAIRVHDGAAYLRAWRRDVGAPRTFRIAQVSAIETLPLPEGESLARIPAAKLLWGDDDPAFGIDRDRPGTGVLELQGAVARWVHRVQWHPSQHDRWLVPGEVLQRSLPYRSCRELARRIASVYDGVLAIRPQALHDEVLALVGAAAITTLPPRMQRVPATRHGTASPRAEPTTPAAPARSRTRPKLGTGHA